MRYILIILYVLLSSVFAWAQEIVLQGRVVDAETGEVLPYATIYVSGSQGTLTNADGEFKLKVDKGCTIRISYVGYDKQTIAANAMPETIRLKPYTTDLRELTIHAINSKQQINNILKHTIGNLRKDYQNRKDYARRYFSRTLTEMNGESYITEAFMVARSAVNLRSVVITSGLQGSDTDDNGGTLNMGYTNIHRLLEVAPMTYESESWESSIKPLTDLRTLHAYYDILVRQTQGGDGKPLYRIDFTWKRDLTPELNCKRNITGTAYVDAETCRLLRFDGSCNNYTMRTNIASLYSYATSMKFQLEYDYFHDAASVSHIVIHGKNEKSSFHELLLALDKEEKLLGHIRNNNGNIVTDIRNAGFEPKLWEKYDIVKRTRDEERAAFGRIKSSPKVCEDAIVDTAQTDNAALRSLWQRLWLFSKRYAQEKVFIHMDNTSYCIGDTIRFAAYMRDTNDKMPSRQSSVLYVELLNHEGFLIERKNIEMVEGYGSGFFSLNREELYGGFYELRAYTRWQLNWGAHERNHSSAFSNLFVNKEKEYAFFRDYDKLYSRVFPVYDRLVEEDFDKKVMTLRPQTKHIINQNKKNLNVQLYPEGGHLVEGIETQVAFEATWDNGEWADGSLYIESDTIPVSNRGRGRFTVTPIPGIRQSFTFVARDGSKTTGTLPSPVKQGATIHAEEIGEDWNVVVRMTEDMIPQHLGLSVMNEGKISYFRQINKHEEKFHIPSSSLMPGVNQATVFDSQGLVLADRLFFVWKDGMEHPTIKIDGIRDRYQPYEKVVLYISHLKADSTVHTHPHYISLAVRDGEKADHIYDNSNIMTEMLLASEVRGFIPDANWFFQNNDAAHHDALDLLLMVQGWRRFSWAEMASNNTWIPTQPKETAITLVGDVYNIPQHHKDEKEKTDFNWVLHTETFPPYYITPVSNHMFNNLGADGHFSVSLPDPINARTKSHVVFMDILRNISDYDIAEINDRNPDDFRGKRSLLLPKNTTGQIQTTKEMGKVPHLIVRLDKPFPRFVQPYNYYQQHLSGGNIKQVQVTQSDFSDKHPSQVFNTDELLYNLDDTGLKIGAVFDTLRAIALLSLGDLNDNITIKDELGKYEGEGSVENYIIYTDANLRNSTSLKSEPITIVEHPYSDRIKRIKPASRTFNVPGFSQRIEFYHPNYNHKPENEKDYRRTLYWSPCLLLNPKGRTRILFYNNSRTTRFSIEAEGLGKDGTLLWGNIE